MANGLLELWQLQQRLTLDLDLYRLIEKQKKLIRKLIIKNRALRRKLLEKKLSRHRVCKKRLADDIQLIDACNKQLVQDLRNLGIKQ